MQRGNVYPTQTDPAIHFTDALAQNVGEAESIQLDEGIAAGRHCRSIIRHLTIISMQGLAWEVVFFNRRSFFGTSPATSGFLSNYRFTASEGRIFSGTSLYHYHAANLDLNYNDLDFENKNLSFAERGGRMHLMLVNRTLGTDKLAGAAGAVRITISLEPTYG